MFDYYQEEESKQIQKNENFLRRFFLRLLDVNYGIPIEIMETSVTKEIYTSIEKEQFEFLKKHKEELFEGQQAVIMNPIIDEFIDKADYFSTIEGYVYDKTITVPNMAAVTT